MSMSRTFVAAFLACASGLYVGLSVNTRAQGQGSIQETGRRLASAEKLDEFGDLRWCDLTARLDNLVIHLQNVPSARAFVIGHDDPQGRPRFAEKRMRIFRQYLVAERAVEPDRLIFTMAADPALENALFELWLVPAGAAPPAPEPTESKAAAFSGKLAKYETDDSFLGLYHEVGYSETDLAHLDLVETLRDQPDSVAYLVIRVGKNRLPGAFGRIARRDVRALVNRYQITADRVHTIDGGEAAGEMAEVEIWVLPKDAPPPSGSAEKRKHVLKEGFMLDALEVSDNEGEDEHTLWALENLAELLREDIEARGFIIARPHQPEPEDADGENAAEAGAAETVAVADHMIEAELETPDDPLTVAERWKRLLVEKYGIEPHRLIVLQGSPRSWGAQLITWLSPKNAPQPDPFAVSAKLDEEAESDESEGDAEVEEMPAPPERQK